MQICRIEGGQGGRLVLIRRADIRATQALTPLLQEAITFVNGRKLVANFSSPPVFKPPSGRSAIGAAASKEEEVRGG